MDEIERLLREWVTSEFGAGAGAWKLTHTSLVVRVEVTASAGYDKPEEAFSEAHRMLAEIAAAGWSVVNSVEITAASEPLEAGEASWHPRLYACLQRQGVDDSGNSPVDAFA